MNKDFSESKLLAMDLTKQFRVLYELASFIQYHQHPTTSSHFEKLKKYHKFLATTEDSKMQKLHKEFVKIKALDYQFEIYLMILERLLGQSKKEYDFLVRTDDQPKQNESKTPIICLLDSIRSAHNVGSMLRNADCFHIESVIMCGLTPPGDHPQVIKTAMGCEEVVSWEYFKNPIDFLKNQRKRGYQIWSIETGRQATSLYQLKTRADKVILLFGHEQFGLSLELLELSDKIVSIDLHGQKNSLNVATSQGIVLSYLTQLN